LSTLSRAVFHPAHLLLRATATPVPSPLSLHDALPISPLFLGYLQGVDFLWTLRLWPEWLFVNSVLLAIYWLMDHFYHHPRETKRDRKSTRLNSSHVKISYAVFCLKKKQRTRAAYRSLT